MYPCSNPELVAAVSEAGGIGVLQPVALTFVHGYELREGIRFMRTLTDKPLGMNALIEASSNAYRNRMELWLDVALEEGIRFFVTSLGKPGWVVERVASVGGVVYHDVTERKWALKAVGEGVHGLIAVNRRAGGHPGPHSADQLVEELADLGLPLVCAGGVGRPQEFARALASGYAAVQMGTRFIATHECSAPDLYKEAIVRSCEDDIVWSERITGVPVAVIDTPQIRRLGLKAGPLARWMLRGRRRKHWMRALYALRSAWTFRKAMHDTRGRSRYWQAGKSVDSIDRIEGVADLMRRFKSAVPVEDKTP